ncbi:hypothetical protein ACYX79_10965 [Stenotrophomonas rhizophila]
MAEFVLKHVKHPGFSSKVATGIAAAGPTGDQYVHLTFYRDGVELLEEYFERDEQQFEHGKKILLTESDRPPKTEFVREDVVRLVIPIARFNEVAAAVAKMNDRLGKLEEPDGE